MKQRDATKQATGEGLKQIEEIPPGLAKEDGRS
jgi:hypothetical protein